MTSFLKNKMQQQKKQCACIAALACLLFTSYVFALPTHWQTLAPGLQYTTLQPVPGLFSGKIYAFKIDLKRYKLELAFAKDQAKASSSVRHLVLANKAILGINGGFFSPHFKPLGLRIKNGKVTSPLKHTSWWGVFFIKNNRAYIVSQRRFKRSRQISFAIQAGPRLIVKGKIPPLKPGDANRSALGITKQGKLLVVATQYLPLSTTELAQIMRRPERESGLGCISAINLDGGSSTQLYAKINTFNLNLFAYAPVADAIVVVPKAMADKHAKIR